MSWAAQHILNWVRNGGIDCYDPKLHNLDPKNLNRLINPASLDIRLSDKVRRLKTHNRTFPLGAKDPFTVLDYDDPAAADEVWGPVETFNNEEPFRLYPGELTLMASYERTTIPCDMCAFLLLKSGGGRRGLEHLHAGFGDPQFDGTWTFELYNMTRQIVWQLRPMQRIMQMVFFHLDDITQLSYQLTGSYNGQTDPEPFRSLPK